MVWNSMTYPFPRFNSLKHKTIMNGSFDICTEQIFWEKREILILECFSQIINTRDFNIEEENFNHPNINKSETRVYSAFIFRATYLNEHFWKIMFRNAFNLLRSAKIKSLFWTFLSKYPRLSINVGLIKLK